MKPVACRGVLLLAFLLAYPAIAEEAEEVLTNADVVALSESGLPASVIITKIEGTKADFDTSVEQLVALSEGGVDGSVIEAMMNKGKAPSANTATSGQSADGRPAPQSGATTDASKVPVRQPGDTFSDALRGGSRGPQMIVISAGSFSMGCVSGLDCEDDQKPVHRVTISQPFAVSKYEITFEDYDRFTYPNKAEDMGWGRGRHPVRISWNDAKEYARWLSRQTGQSYRLLTEAEWEYAARAASRTKYSWGNDIGTNRANCGGCGDPFENTAPVGSFGANAFGLHDMHGNVAEWVEDCWNDTYAGAPSDGTAWNRGDCSQRLLRGGDWISGPKGVRSADRFGFPAGKSQIFTGFRVARTLTP